MATPESLEPSRRLSEAALAERDRLLRRLEQIEQRNTKLSGQMSELDAECKRLTDRLALLEELVPGDAARHLHPVAPTARSDEPPPRGYLRGAGIRREAVRILARGTSPEAPIHYTDWLAQVHAAGYGINSRDPAASFLTQISRSALVARTEQPGVYALDLDAPSRLHAQLNHLHAELSAIHDGQQTLEAIVSTRDRREQLLTEIVRTERTLEEALATLDIAQRAS